MVPRLAADTRPAAPLTRAAVLSRRYRLRRMGTALVTALLLPLPAFAAGSGAGLAEPTEKELRHAYLDFLYDFVAIQGEFVEPGCSLESAVGCSVRLLDIRRDYRLVAFKKTACHATEPTGYACSFEARVTCSYTAKTKPSADVADLYCGPVFNKTSTYVAQLDYTQDGWLISRFLEG
ncbi:MAG: hypothetical protein U1E43_01835 [Rhodospirillales bacterium]